MTKIVSNFRINQSTKTTKQRVINFSDDKDVERRRYLMLDLSHRT